MDYRSKRRALTVLAAFVVMFAIGTAFAFMSGGLNFEGTVRVDAGLGVRGEGPIVVRSAVQLSPCWMMTWERNMLTWEAGELDHRQEPLRETPTPGSGASSIQQFLAFEQRGYVILQYTLRNTGTLPAELHFVRFPGIQPTINTSFGQATVEHTMATSVDSFDSEPAWFTPFGNTWGSELTGLARAEVGLDMQGVRLGVGESKSIYIKVSYMFDYEELWNMFNKDPFQFMAMFESPQLLQSDFPRWEQWEKEIVYSIATTNRN